VALSENLSSQIHQLCGREGNETRLLLREKDFEREKAKQKAKKKNKREERERERNRSKEQKQKRERAFFSFSGGFASLFALVFLSIFFLSRCESSAVVKHSNAPFFSHDACF